MTDWIGAFYVAVTLLTQIPLPIEGDLSREDLGRATGWFPLVGLFIGVFGWLLFKGIDLIPYFNPPAGVSAVIVLLAWALLTGALHWDGFCDMLDALGAQQKGREKILEVMRDSRIGSFAAVGLVFVLLLEFEALRHLIDKGGGISSRMILAPIIARWACTVLCVFGKPAKPSGMGASCIEAASWGDLFPATLVAGIALVVFLLNIVGMLMVILVTIGIIAAVYTWSQRVLSGQTGDVLGFAATLVEAAVLIVVASV